MAGTKKRTRTTTTTNADGTTSTTEDITGDVLDFDALSPKQKAALSRALLRMAQQEAGAAPAEVDLSGVPSFYITHDPDNVEVYRAEGDLLVDKDGNKYESHNRAGGHAGFSKSPISDAPLGHAPVAYNGFPIHTFENHEGLRRGDPDVIAKHSPNQEDKEVA